MFLQAGSKAVVGILKKFIAFFCNFLRHIIDVLLCHFLVIVVEVIPDTLQRYPIVIEEGCHGMPVIMGLEQVFTSLYNVFRLFKGYL